METNNIITYSSQIQKILLNLLASVSEQLLVGQGRSKEVFVYIFKLEFYKVHKLIYSFNVL